MSYAVLWSVDHEPIHAGRLVLLPGSLLLEGGSTCGAAHRYELDYDEIAGVAIGRGPSERLRGRPVALIRRVTGELLRVAALGGAGLLVELVEQIDAARVGDVSR